MSEKDDLTRIEDLQEFVHEDEPEDKSEELLAGELDEEQRDEPVSHDGDGGLDFSKQDWSGGEGELFAEVDEEKGLAQSEDELPPPPLPEFSNEIPNETPDEPPGEIPGESMAAPELDLALEAEVDPEPEPLISSPQVSEGEQALEEIHKFSTQMTYGQLSLGQGPPFSVIIRKIKDEETGNEVRGLLGEMGLDPAQFEQGIALGQVLIGQINEYCAIYLTHKLRNFNVEIEMGPSGLIHPAQNYESENQRGVPHDPRADQSKAVGQDFRQWQGGEFFISNSSQAPFAIKEHLGSIQAVRKVTSRQLSELPPLQDVGQAQQEDYQGYLEQYHGLVQELKERALKRGAHGLIQLSFQLTPLADSGNEEFQYHLLAMGHLVRF